MTDSGVSFETEKHLWTCEAEVLEFYLGHRKALCVGEMIASVSEGFVILLSLCLTVISVLPDL